MNDQRIRKFSVLWLNVLPCKGGLKGISPRELITGVKVDYNIHCKLSFGDYVQTHEEGNIKNGPEARTLGAISLGPNATSITGYWFLNLNTGKVVHRRSWTALPMPQEVIQRVELLAKRDHQPPLLTFCNRYGVFVRGNKQG